LNSLLIACELLRLSCTPVHFLVDFTHFMELLELLSCKFSDSLQEIWKINSSFFKSFLN